MIPAPHGFSVPEEFNEYTAVKVTNVGTTTFKGGHAGKTFVIAPGESRFVQWDAVCRWVGNPFAVNVGDDRATHWRTGEADRLSTLYGTYSDPWTTEDEHEVFMEGAPPGMKPMRYVLGTDGKYHHPHLPQLEVRDSHDKVLKTVLADPEGADITPAQATTIAERSALEDQLAEVRRLQAQLQLQLAQNATNVPVNPEFEEDRTSNPDSESSITPEPKSPGRPTVGDPRSTPSNGPRRGPGRPPKSS